MHITHRPGNTSDLGFICSCLLSDARKGHFSIDVNDRQAVHHVRQEIAAMLGHDSAHAVYTFLIGEKRVGFAILSSLPARPRCRELYALSVAVKFRGRGYGHQLLLILLQKLQQHIVYARCAPSSVAMQQMLLGHNFQCIQETEKGIRIFRRDNLAATDLAVTGMDYRHYLAAVDRQPSQAQTSEK